jgi:hypothetical protein
VTLDTRLDTGYDGSKLKYGTALLHLASKFFIGHTPSMLGSNNGALSGV